MKDLKKAYYLILDVLHENVGDRYVYIIDKDKHKNEWDKWLASNFTKQFKIYMQLWWKIMTTNPSNLDAAYKTKHKLWMEARMQSKIRTTQNIITQTT